MDRQNEQRIRTNKSRERKDKLTKSNNNNKEKCKDRRTLRDRDGETGG